VLSRLAKFVQGLRGQREDTSLPPLLRKVLEAQARAGFQSLSLSPEGTPIRLGRAPANDLILEDSSTSDQHAQIKLEKGRLWVRDLGSANGSAVNRDPIPARQWIALRPTDRLFLGRQEITFELVLEPSTLPMAAPRPAASNRQNYGGSVYGDSEFQADRFPSRPLSRARRSPSFELSGRQAQVGVGLLVGLFLLGWIVSSRSRPEVTETPAPAMVWSFRGRVQVPDGGKQGVLSVRMPEISFVYDRPFTPDAQGNFQFDFPVRIKGEKIPTKLDVELKQDGQLVASSKGLAMPAPGGSMLLPTLAAPGSADTDT
jgi:hypothetical protein